MSYQQAIQMLQAQGKAASSAQASVK